MKLMNGVPFSVRFHRNDFIFYTVRKRKILFYRTCFFLDNRRCQSYDKCRVFNIIICFVNDCDRFLLHIMYILEMGRSSTTRSFFTALSSEQIRPVLYSYFHYNLEQKTKTTVSKNSDFVKITSQDLEH